MRFITNPRKYIKENKAFHEKALNKMQMKTFDISSAECIQKIYSLKDFFKDVHGFSGSSEEINSLSLIHYAYSHFLAGAATWLLGMVVTKEKDPSYDYQAVVSPNSEYVIDTFGLILLAFRTERDLMVDLYEKIKNGQLPPSEPNKFLNLVEYFYEDKNKEKYDPFIPLETEEREEWLSSAQQGAKICNATLDSEHKPNPADVRTILLHMEQVVFAQKPGFHSTTDEGEYYLNSLSALYGQCLRAVSNWELAISWDETDEGIEGLPVLHSPDKQYWISPYATLYRELTSGRKTTRLLSFYRTIMKGNLPPVEGESPEELK